MNKILINLSIVYLLMLRVALTCLQFYTFSPTSIVLGSLSVIALVTNGIAMWKGKIDQTWGGVAVGVGHLAILLVQTPAETVLHWQIIFWSAVAFQTWAKWNLWERTTVTVPAFVSLEKNGAYSWIRHPMTLAELFMVMAICWQQQTTWNGFAFAFVFASKIMIVECEERFLRQFAVYRRYCEQVRYKLFDGIY